MLRGEVWWVSFTGSLGGEIRKTRPAIIVSNDAAARHSNRVQVVPLSSKIDQLYPSETKVVVAGKESKAMADQIATVAKERLKKRMGTVASQDMHGVDFVLRVQLGLAV